MGWTHKAGPGGLYTLKSGLDPADDAAWECMAQDPKQAPGSGATKKVFDVGSLLMSFGVDLDGLLTGTGKLSGWNKQLDLLYVEVDDKHSLPIQLSSGKDGWEISQTSDAESLVLQNDQGKKHIIKPNTPVEWKPSGKKNGAKITLKLAVPLTVEGFLYNCDRMIDNIQPGISQQYWTTPTKGLWVRVKLTDPELAVSYVPFQKGMLYWPTLGPKLSPLKNTEFNLKDELSSWDWGNDNTWELDKSWENGDVSDNLTVVLDASKLKNKLKTKRLWYLSKTYYLFVDASSISFENKPIVKTRSKTPNKKNEVDKKIQSDDKPVENKN